MEAPKSDIIEIVKDAVTELGLASLEVDSEEGKGLIAYPEDHKNAELLLCSAHLDIVPPGDETKWNFSPWIGDIHDNKIRGRGSVDMKGGAAAFLEAFRQVQQKTKTAPPVLFAFSTDEEVSMKSTEALAKKLINFNLKNCLISEPTLLKVGIMEKGVLWYKIIAQGKSAHGSTPEYGRNAIFELLPFLHLVATSKWKEGIEKDEELLKLLTGNLGEIKGGTAPNVVPDRVETSFDIRYPPSIHPNSIEVKMQKLCNENKLELVKIQELPGVETASDHTFVQLVSSVLKKMHKKVEKTYVSYATDAAIYSTSCSSLNLTAVICGPGDPQMAHQTNEVLPVQEFFDAIELYAKIFESIF
ncbi:MAG: M20 family metallopeptidase [Promethearchaeota archaeon]